MKKHGKGHGTKERPQGKIGPSGINKKAEPAKVPQVKMETKYGKPGQWDKS